jgi:hypothetical protein
LIGLGSAFLVLSITIWFWPGALGLPATEAASTAQVTHGILVFMIGAGLFFSLGLSAIALSRANRLEIDERGFSLSRGRRSLARVDWASKRGQFFADDHRDDPAWKNYGFYDLVGVRLLPGGTFTRLPPEALNQLEQAALAAGWEVDATVRGDGGEVVRGRKRFHHS